MKYITILIITVILLFFNNTIFSKEKDCYIDLVNKTKIDSDIIINISMSLIGKFVKKIKPSPVSGINYKNDCFYRVSLQNVDDELFLTFSGEGLKSFGSSKKERSEGFKESLVLALLRGVEDQREKICREYGKDLEDCESIQYWMDLVKPNNRFLVYPLNGFYLQYDYLYSESLGFGYTIKTNKNDFQPYSSYGTLGSPSLNLNYQAHFLNISYIGNIIPQINIGMSIGLLLYGKFDVVINNPDIFGATISVSEKSKQLSNSSHSLLVFMGYQISKIEYIFGINYMKFILNKPESTIHYTENDFSDPAQDVNFKYENKMFLTPIFGMGFSF